MVMQSEHVSEYITQRGSKGRGHKHGPAFIEAAYQMREVDGETWATVCDALQIGRSVMNRWQRSGYAGRLGEVKRGS